MGAVIAATTLGLDAHVIKKVLFDEEAGRARIPWDRDRRRARGTRDMTYFKKIFQLNTRDTPSFLYNRV